MNPPAALAGAMGRERKPFSYLPGGLDLSQIKSEKMAQRLMRNAMNEGVPERPVQNIQSPTTPTTPIPVPNFNCLPVQVFPTFQLPANPKSLLRTRSTPNQHRDPVLEANQQQNAFRNNVPSVSEKTYKNNVTHMANNDQAEKKPAYLYSKIPEINEYDNSRKSFEAVRPVVFNPYELANAQNNNHEPYKQPCNSDIEYNNNLIYDTNSRNFVKSPVSTTSSVPDYNDNGTSRKNYDAVRPVVFNPYGLLENNQNVCNEPKTQPTYSEIELNTVNKPATLYNTILNENEKAWESNEAAKPAFPNSYDFPTYNESKDVSGQDDVYNYPHVPENQKDPTPSIVVNNNNELKPLLPSEIIKIRAKSQEKNTILNVVNNNSLPNEIKKVNSSDISAYEHKINDSIAELKSIDIGNETPINKNNLNTSEDDENIKSEVKTSVSTTKQVNSETRTEKSTNESENGVADAEAELTVKLPSKKSAAKTETKVEIVKKILPDGAVEEVKTTTTTTTVDGRTEIKTRTETKTIPKETEEEFEEEYEEEEEEESKIQEEEIKQNGHETENSSSVIENEVPLENGHNDTVVTKEERSETTTTKKTVISSTTDTTKDEDEEEVVEEEEEVIEDVEESEQIVENDPQSQDLEQPLKPQEAVEVEDEEEEEEVIEEEEEEEIVKEEEKEVIAKEVVEITEDDSSVVEKETALNEADTVKSDVKKVLDDEPEVQKEETVEETKESTEKVVDEEEEDEYEAAEEEVTEEKVVLENEVVQQTAEVAVETPQTEENVSQTEEKEVANEKEPKSQEQKPSQPDPTPEPKPVTREIPIHFDTVEDIEIKPIGPASGAISRTRTESTEIITSKDNLGGPISTQTELHRIENIVVQNRLTKTLDQSYEQLTQQGLPTAKTYFAPTREPVSISPQPAKPYLSSYTDPTERRHSLLLDRLSVERQLPPPEQYQVYNNVPNETQSQYQEPQSEVLTVSNVKPSMITNQQWYQQTNKENVIYNNVETSTATNQSQWTQQEKPQYQPKAQTPFEPQYQAPSQPQYQAPSQPQYQAPSQPQYQAPSQPQYQAPSQPQYQAPSQPHYEVPYQPQYQSPTQPQYQAPSQPLYQAPSQPQYQAPPQPQYQAPLQSQYQAPYQPPFQTTTQAPQYQPPQTPQYQPQATLSPYQAPQKPTLSPQTYTDSYSSNYSKSTNTLQQNSYPNYTSTPETWGTSNDLPKLSTQLQSQYSSLNKESTDSYKQNTQQYSSSYVPPPWEQDSSSYIPETPQTYYQPESQQTSSAQNAAPAWKPAQAQSKPKPPPTAYVPPAPNQSFVLPVTKADAPRVAGRKTYYSEYERRYISVPESTYVPAETKYKAQPDPSPQYYYDNDEAVEKEEHAWRKELREFTEKSSQTPYTTESVRPPWEEEQAYPKTPTAAAAITPTPTWSQTLRPRSGRERTFESDYSSQEFSRTNTIGRGRPLSTYAQSDVPRKIERSRGVSVDRYNPNSYKSPIPMEHPPVQSHTLTPASAPPIKFHANPNVPAYHNSRASAEPREQPASYNPRSWGDSRAEPVQSRSFKYLQWITGTDE